MQIDLQNSGAAAIDALRANRYDLIFMDHRMVEMDGIETTLLIRGFSEPYYKNVPIIALTANAVSGMEEMFMKNGFNGFISKPIDTIKLNAVLKRWIPKEKQRTAKINDAAPKEQKVIKFEIEGLDVNKGMLMSDGDFDLYSEVLITFYRDGLIKLKEIAASIKAEDLSLYTIYAHALKSACANIGADKLAGAAEKLETAGNQADWVYIREHNIKFIESLEKLLKDINDAIKKIDESKRKSAGILDLDMAKVKAELAGLKDTLDNFDIAASNRIISGLLQLTQATEIHSVIREIYDNILTGGYDEAVSLIENIIK